MVFDKSWRLFPQDQALTHCRVSMKFDKSESPFRPDQFIFYLTVTKSDLNKNIGKFQRVKGIRHWINQNNRSAVQSESSLSRKKSKLPRKRNIPLQYFGEYIKNSLEIIGNKGNVVGARGFEPPTSRSRTVRSTRLSHAPTSQLTSLREPSGLVKCRRVTEYGRLAACVEFS